MKSFPAEGIMLAKAMRQELTPLGARTAGMLWLEQSVPHGPMGPSFHCDHCRWVSRDCRDAGKKW